MEMMPSYIRDFLSFPKHLLEAYDLYHYGKKRKEDMSAKIEEAIETSNKIIYDLDNAIKNPYYMIKQNCSRDIL